MWDVAAWDVFECDGDGFHFRATVTVAGEATPRAIQAYAALGVMVDARELGRGRP